MTLHGEKAIRGDQRVALSPISEGRFGRMFRRLRPAPNYPDDVLELLSGMMRESVAAPAGGWASAPVAQPGGDNPAIPSAYTYLGQFIDHDITFDPNSSLEQQNDPDALHNFRSPRYDLDSLYGSGPDDEPFQYRLEFDPPKLLVEANVRGMEDLPRTSQGRAIIGDPRNDENIIVSQLHLVFAKFHNRLADDVSQETGLAPDQRFAEVQRRVRWTYQQMIVHDYLPRLVGEELMGRLFDQTGPEPDIRLRYYQAKSNAYMPIEFSAAAFRFGHSQIRGFYDLNDQVTARPVFLPGQVGEFDDLRGLRPLPPNWTIDWKHFVDLPGANPQPSRLIDTHLSDGLFTLPSNNSSLPFRNLRRGQTMELPSGQDVARFIGARDVIAGADLGDGVPEHTPLWFYILREAEVLHGGTRLGWVGGRIVAEVLLGMLKLDKTSWINVDPTWRSPIPVTNSTHPTLADIVAFATT